MSTPHEQDIAATVPFTSPLSGISDDVIAEHATGVLEQEHPAETGEPFAVPPPRRDRAVPTTSIGERARDRANSRGQ